MKIIKSHQVPQKLTHVMPSVLNYFGIQKYGIKITSLNQHMLWKPEAFWISMDNDWETWCYWEEFGNTSKCIICDVTLKKNLKLLKITTLDDAEELASLLMPNYTPRRIFGQTKLSDLISLSMYMTDKLEQGILVGPEIWNPIIKNYDGIYYVNSSSLHSETFFNTWDCHCIALFNGANATLSNPSLGKIIIDKIKKQEDVAK